MGQVITNQDDFLKIVKTHYSQDLQGPEDAFITYSKGDKTSVFRATVHDNKPLLLHCDLDGRPLFDQTLRDAISKDYPFIDVSRAERYRDLMQGLQGDSNYFPTQFVKLSEQDAITKLKECPIQAFLALETAHNDKLAHKPHAPTHRFFSTAKAPTSEKPEEKVSPDFHKPGK